MEGMPLVKVEINNYLSSSLGDISRLDATVTVKGTTLLVDFHDEKKILLKFLD